VDQIVIGSCTNGRLDNLAVAAKIMNGAKIAPNMHMLIRHLWPADYRSVTETVG
jgi:3-isopropylmalate/(R)-2-methylmalate dehydratase large subunit